MKKIFKITGCALLIGIVFVVGSGCLRGFWLVPRPSKAARVYGKADPNKLNAPLVFLGEVEELRRQIAIAHIVTQIDLNALQKKDKGVHTVVSDEVKIIVDTGAEQYGTWVGSVDKPGVLWSALMLGAGGGGAAAILRRIWYTEDEKNVEVEKARNSNS